MIVINACSQKFELNSSVSVVWFGVGPMNFIPVQTDYLTQSQWAAMFFGRVEKVLNPSVCDSICAILSTCDLWTHKDNYCGIGSTQTVSQTVLSAADLATVHINPGAQ